MPEKLNPCPACGASVRLEGGRQWHDRHRFIIRCENLECGCVRIGDTERSECIRRWNSLPRALTWVKELPVEPGQYFCLWSDGSVSAENLTAYIEHWRGKAPVRRLSFPWDRFTPIQEKQGIKAWAGPIPLPLGSNYAGHQ